MKFRPMHSDEIFRIGEVNREEIVHAEYVPRRDSSGFGLVAVRELCDPPLVIGAWSATGIEKRVASWRPALERGGRMYGAFADQTLVGFVILGPGNPDSSGEIVALFVDRDHRRKGIAARLMSWVETEAAALGMESLYLYANPTESSIDFYLKVGFEITGMMSKGIVSSLPGDIVMARKLGD